MIIMRIVLLKWMEKLKLCLSRRKKGRIQYVCSYVHTCDIRDSRLSPPYSTHLFSSLFLSPPPFPLLFIPLHLSSSLLLPALLSSVLSFTSPPLFSSSSLLSSSTPFTSPISSTLLLLSLSYLHFTSTTLLLFYLIFSFLTTSPTLFSPPPLLSSHHLPYPILTTSPTLFSPPSVTHFSPSPTLFSPTLLLFYLISSFLICISQPPTNNHSESFIRRKRLK